MKPRKKWFLKKTPEKKKLRSLMLFDKSLTKKVSFCDGMAYLFCLLLLFSCAALGPGRFVVIHGVTPRMLLFGGILLFSLPMLLHNRKNLARNAAVIAWCAFLGYMFFSAFRGYSLGNNSAVLASDVKGFLYFLMLPAFLCVFRDAKRIEAGMKIVILGSGLLAVGIVMVELLFNISTSFLGSLSVFSETNFLFINYVSPQIVRLFSPSTPYMVAAISFCIYFQCIEKKLRWYYVVATSFALVAIVISFTRSVYLASCVGFLVSVVLALISGYARPLVKHLLLSLAFTAVLLGGFYVAFDANLLGFAYDRSIGNISVSKDDPNPDDQGGKNSEVDQGNATAGGTGNETGAGKEEKSEVDILDAIDHPESYIDTSKDPAAQIDAYLGYSQIVSDAYRQYTLKELSAKIKAAPVFGHGLGATIKHRDLNEYFYLDALMKMGIVGLCLYLLPAFLSGFWFFRKVKCLRGEPAQRRSMLLVGAAVAGFFGIAVFSFFNPYLNAVLGEAVYCFGIAAVVLLKNKGTSLEYK